MKVVYEPKGAALEYSPLALNLYNGCSHGCTYCYAPAVMRRRQDDFCQNITPRANVIEKFKHDADLLSRRKDTRHVLLCFTSDPLQPAEEKYRLTEQALKVIYENRLNSKILTKGRYSIVSEYFEIMKSCKTEFGITLSLSNEDTRKEIEPNAASIEERIQLLKEAKEIGIKTWVSMEPVIYRDQALSVIEKCHPFVDEWKVGKINHCKQFDFKQDWCKFKKDVVELFGCYGLNNYTFKESLNGKGNTK